MMSSMSAFYRQRAGLLNQKMDGNITHVTYLFTACSIPELHYTFYSINNFSQNKKFSIFEIGNRSIYERMNFF